MKISIVVIYHLLLSLLLVACGGSSSDSASDNNTVAYDISDLQGTWKVHSLASGPGAPWWERGTVVIASDGSFTATTTESDGGGGNPSGMLNISSDGEITMSGSSTLLGNMDADKTVMVWTDSWSSGSPGTTELKVLTKAGSSYTTADLTGTWKIHTLASGPGAPWWNRGSFTIASDGSFIANMFQSDGNTDNPSGIFYISNDGEITLSINGTLSGNMDADKTVMVITDTWLTGSPGTTGISLLLKTGSSYTTADLTGTWKVHSLASGPGAPWWERGSVVIASDGSFAATTTESDGGGGNPSGMLNVSPDGAVTMSGSSTFLGNMDADKTVMVWTDTWSSGSPGTTELKVLVKDLE